MIQTITATAGNVVSNVFTNTERRLLMIYRCGSVSDTADILREAHREIYDRDTLAAVEQLLSKLDGMDDASFAATLESEGSYA